MEMEDSIRREISEPIVYYPRVEVLGFLLLQEISSLTPRLEVSYQTHIFGQLANSKKLYNL